MQLSAASAAKTGTTLQRTWIAFLFADTLLFNLASSTVAMEVAVRLQITSEAVTRTDNEVSMVSAALVSTKRSTPV